MTTIEYPGTPEERRALLKALGAWCECVPVQRCAGHLALLNDHGFALRLFEARARRIELNISEFMLKLP